jgi:polyisoprenyl-phosphate glycosyltransferase
MQNANKTQYDLSIVVPMFNEGDNVTEFVNELSRVVSSITLCTEIILVNDGSTDDTWIKILECSKENEHLKGICLSRNFGHQNALFAGLICASGKAIISMDGDLQHPPNVIPELVSSWQEGNMIVETRRIDSPDTGFFKRFSSRLFYSYFSKMSGIPMSEGSSDFRLIDRRVADVIVRMQDADLFLRGITHWVGFNKKVIPYQAGVRFAGTTKYSLKRMIKFSMSAILSFSTIPLKAGIWVGLITSIFGAGELVYIFVMYFRGDTVPGWSSIVAITSFMFSVLFLLLGIIGAYLSSIFEMIKNRPRFIIMQRIGNFNDDKIHADVRYSDLSHLY